MMNLNLLTGASVKKVRLMMLLGCLVGEARALDTRVLVQWDFTTDAEKAWVHAANHSKDVQIVDGVLKGTITSWDPFVTSLPFSIEASANQVIELRVRTTARGAGNIYWVPEGVAGPQEKLNVSLNWMGDHAWHEYRVYPYWQGDKRIVRLRIDFAGPSQALDTYEVDWVRVVEMTSPTTAAKAWCGSALGVWNGEEGRAVVDNDHVLALTAAPEEIATLFSPALTLPAESNPIVAIEMSTESGDEGMLCWASSAGNGCHSKRFRIQADGKRHTYNLDLTGEKMWQGEILMLKMKRIPKLWTGRSSGPLKTGSLFC